MLDDEKFPDDWDIQGVFTEGPRFTVKDGWIYLSLSVGGTQGPAQAHGILVYRSRHAQGPWEPSPYNPVMRTYSRHEKWINKGHGALVEGPDGKWYIIYHGFLRNRYNQARMPLMEPIEWTEDGWYRIPDWSSPAKPLPIPQGGVAVTHYRNSISGKKSFARGMDLPWNHQAEKRKHRTGIKSERNRHLFS